MPIWLFTHLLFNITKKEYFNNIHKFLLSFICIILNDDLK